MKRFLTLIVAVCAFFAASAQHPMVTLSHNGELSFFTNLYALESALSAAERGDTIFLSEGDFVINGGSLNIAKIVSIVGAGYSSHPLGDIVISGEMYQENYMVDAPWFDGVRLDKLSFQSSGPDGSIRNKQEVRRCWITSLYYPDYGAKEMTIDNCYLENVYFAGNSACESVLKNCKILRAEYIGLSTVINCNIANSNYFPNTMISSIFNLNFSSSSVNVSGSTCSILNSLLRTNPNNYMAFSNVYTDGCYVSENGESLLDDKLDCVLDLAAKGYVGKDGSVVGVYGGESPFSENPSVPTIDSEKSSVEYDVANNKLKVSITVKTD